MIPEALIGAAADRALGKILDTAHSLLSQWSLPEHDVSERLRSHLTFTANWSQRVFMMGMARARDTDTETIPLTISAVPRRFRSSQDAALLNERDLLSGGDHFLLLGDPGAGKTTTLQRLAHQVLFEAAGADDGYQYPLVFRARTLGPGNRLDVAIARSIGMPYELRAVRTPIGENEWRDDIEAVAGGVPVIDLAATFIDTTGAVLILDGIDEVDANARRLLHEQLSELALKLSVGKIIASCRTGAYQTQFQPFHPVELCGLSEQQARKIVMQWLPEPEAFLSQLQQLPYRDVTDRPLLLVQLLIFFALRGIARAAERDLSKNSIASRCRMGRRERDLALLKVCAFST